MTHVTGYADVGGGARLARRLGLRSAGLLALALLLQACTDEGVPPAVGAIELSPPQATLLVGDTLVLAGAAKSTAGAALPDAPLAWSSRQPALLAVTGSGGTARAVGVRAGTAEVQVAAEGRVAVAVVEVRNRVPALGGVEPSSVTAGTLGTTVVVTGGGFAQDAQVTWNGAPRTTHYVSAGELRVSLAAADVATAGEASIAVVNAAPGGGTSAVATFRVLPAFPARVDMSPATASIAVGTTTTLQAQPRDLFGNPVQADVAWTSSQPDVATVTAAGIVTGVSAGTAFIAAAIPGGLTGVATVTVTGPLPAPPVIASISPDSAESGPGGLEITIRGSGFLPSSGAFLNGSSRPTAYVSATELTITLWPGDLGTSATRQIQVFNPGGGGMSGPVPLRIVPGVWRIVIAPEQVSLWPGQEVQLTATAYDYQNRLVTGRKITWTTNSPDRATVDSTGRVRALAPGPVTIDARIGERTGFRGIAVLTPLPWDLLYEGTHGGYPELWLLTIGPDAAPRRILPAGTYGSDPAASPDGRQIAFVGLSVDGARNIFVVDRDGRNLRQLTSHPEIDDQPAWSRDGTRIAFRSMRDGASDIFVMNADGTGLVNATRNAERLAEGRVAAERPSWTVAGRLVFSYGFELLSPKPYRLITTLPDGTDWKALTDGFFREYEAEVSPSGTHIALRRGSQYGEYLDVIAGNGTDLMWMNHPGSGSTPSWSPDSRWLTFAFSDGPGHSGIHVMSLNSMVGAMAESMTLVPSGGRNPVFIRRD